MTTTTSTTAYRSDQISVGTATAAGVASAITAGALLTLFAHDWGEVVFSLSLLAVVTAGVFGLVVPRALRKESAGGTALALSIPAALLVVVAFWTGIPLVLGAAGVVVGSAGRRARTGGGKSIAAVVLGALAIAAHLAIYVSEAIAGSTGFLLG